MAGLLDFLNPQDPAKQQGLLAAAAALLQAGGPSRIPISTGQGIGAALGAYQQGFQGAQDRQQQQALYDVKLADLKSDLANQDRRRAMESEIAKAVAELQSPSAGAAQKMEMQAPVPYSPSGQSPFMQRMAALGGAAPPAGKFGAQQYYDAAMEAGLPNPGGIETSNQIIGRVNSLGETPSTAARALSGGAQGAVPSQVNIASSGGARVNLTDQWADQQMKIAQIRLEKGDVDGALKLMENIQKLRPKYSTEFRQAQDANGKLHNYVLADDGTYKDTGLGVAPNLTEVDLGGTKQFVDKNTVAPGTSFNKTMTFADRQSAARLAFDKSQASGGDDAARFTQAAIDNAAARYNVDGSLPPMGMGQAAAAGRTKILNRAAELKAGVDPAQQRLDQLNNKGDVAARNASVRSFATGKDGQAVQAANTALNHLATVRELAIAQKSGDVQAFNRVARQLGAQFGQTAPTNLNAALVMVGPEISKAVVGVAGTGHEREEAKQALNPNGSPDQIISGTGVMEELFGGRITEAKRTYERTTMKKDFDDTMLSPAARQVLSRAEAHGASAPAPAGQFSVQAPNGKTYTFKTARDMANFKLSAGIR